MAVSAGIVGDTGIVAMIAIVAGVYMAAQSRGSAFFNVIHYCQLSGPGRIAVAILVSVQPKNIRYLQLWSRRMRSH